jgi:hypothetical protein
MHVVIVNEKAGGTFVEATEKPGWEIRIYTEQEKLAVLDKAATGGEPVR